jgi:hypothetical protein
MPFGDISRPSTSLRQFRTSYLAPGPPFPDPLGQDDWVPSFAAVCTH